MMMGPTTWGSDDKPPQLAAGGAVTFANPMYTSPEIAHQLEDSGASVVFVHPEALPALLGAVKLLSWTPSHIKTRIILATHTQFISPTLVKEGWLRFDDLTTGRGLRSLDKPVSFSGNKSRTETMFLYYSSGTTGKSKGVMTTHYNVTAQLLQTDSNWGAIYAEQDVCLVSLLIFKLNATFTRVRI